MLDTKKIILHIGSPKTGTTSIQEMLNDNQHELLRLGLLYPQTGRLKPEECYVYTDLKVLENIVDIYLITTF